MFRSIQSELLAWRRSPSRKPLVLRGARQVGKSHIVENYLAGHFRQLIVVNFERAPDFKLAFEGSLSPKSILLALRALGTPEITAGETLLFLDEIQECPKALTALRYFHEEMPELHIIAAGSLLELALEGNSVPVGRVTYRYMGPLTFEEYLLAGEGSFLVEILREHDSSKPLPPAWHKSLLDHLSRYMAFGGMPAVVNGLLGGADFAELDQLLNDILISYRDDIPKYASRRKELEEISLVFSRVPQLIGKQFKYAQISREARAHSLRSATTSLARAGILNLSFSAHGSPLEASIRSDRFRIFFLDVGLLQRSLGLSSSRWFENKGSLIHTGVIAEQFVAQQLASHDYTRPPTLHYWERNKPGSSAEVDFLVETTEETSPVEVKAGARGNLKSLLLYLQEHPGVTGYRFYDGNFDLNDRVHSIPLYYINEWLRQKVPSRDNLPAR